MKTKQYANSSSESLQSSTNLKTITTPLKEDKNTNTITIHAGCIHLNSLGLLIRGSAGIGKSESMLNCLQNGWTLICDDVCILEKKTNKIFASPHPQQHGIMHLRDVGCFNVNSIGYKYSTQPILIIGVIDLVSTQPKNIARINDNITKNNFLDINIPCINISTQHKCPISTLISICHQHFINLQPEASCKNKQ